jgi:DNA-binding transcriptional ArsR family regulator
MTMVLLMGSASHRTSPAPSGTGRAPLRLNRTAVQLFGCIVVGMAAPHPIPPELADLIATRLKTIGDPTRVQLLDLLRDGERSVGELSEALGTSQQNASKHLGVLLQAGIVGRRKAGTSALYRVTDSSVYDLCELVCGGLQDQVAGLAAIVGA